MNFRAVAYILGWLIACFGATMILPMLVALSYNDVDAYAFLQASSFSIFGGVFMVLITRQQQLTLSRRDGFLLTFLTWAVLSLIGAVPLYLSGAAGSIVNALFEATSGLTATGATVFSGLDQMGHGILLWRAMLQWLGGMGILILAVAILPFLGVGGMQQLYSNELPGVTKDKLQPRLRETARSLWIIYVMFTVLCAFLYLLAGMTPFDALCHALTTVASGGYSTHDASFGYYDSPFIHLIGIVFMLVAATNFALHFAALRGKNPGTYFRDGEFTMFLSVLGGMTLLGGAALYLYEQELNLLETLFTYTSILTSTGYTMTDYNQWPVASQYLLIICMFIGGCSGSTAGGIKVLRLMTIIRQGMRELHHLLHPWGVRHVKINKMSVPDHIIQAVWAFVGLYMLTYLGAMLVMAASGLDFISAASAAAATLNMTGPGLGEVGPTSTYDGLTDGAKLASCLIMVMGRLEVFTVLMLFVPAFWRR